MTRGKAVQSINEALMWCDSHDRIDTLIRCIGRANEGTFWTVFNDWFCGCDNTWSAQGRLLSMLRRRHPAGCNYLSPEARAFHDTFPERVQVYRGCHVSRVRGLSWTTNQAVAKGFAHGHRGMRVPDAVVVTASIPNDRIFTVFVDRQESEVLVDPAHLVIEDVAPYREQGQ
jgi:hypothetical protein